MPGCEHLEKLVKFGFWSSGSLNSMVIAFARKKLYNLQRNYTEKKIMVINISTRFSFVVDK